MISRNSSVRRPRSMRGAQASDRLKAGAALGLSMAMLMPGAALAQAQESDQGSLATVTVEDTAIDPNPNAQVGVPYKARTSGDERHTRPLAETPQTITVLTRTQIEESGYTDLVRILDAQPGVTVGTGENGNAFGDRYIIRGQEARSDVFVDGLRDPGMTTRESFAIEQLEISKGPSSSFAGRGTAGGAINAITKQATTDYNFGKGSIGLGSDHYVRATADVNYSTGNTFAIRANAMYSYTEVPDRGPADRERKGLAVSALYAPTDDLSITLDYYGLRAHDNPDVGGYLNSSLKPVLPPVYAQEQDFQDSDVDTVTGRIKYAFNDNVRVTNLTRYGTSDNGYVITGARGANTVASNPGGIYPTITFSDHQGWQEVEYFANQTNLFINVGSHDIIVGAEYTDHKVLNGVYVLGKTGAFNCRTTGTGAVNNYCGIGANGQPVNGLDTLLGRTVTRGNWDQDWKMETISGYLMDTFDITPALTVFAGLRADHFKFHLRTQNTNTQVVNFDDGYSDTFFNGHLGVTYKVGDGGMFYASVSTSADINCGESDVGTNAGYGGCVQSPATTGVPPTIAGAKPERSWNFELGTKWNILNEKLLLTAAVFQTNKNDVMEGATAPAGTPSGYDPSGYFNTGANRVRGVELGLVGNVTDAWSVQGGLTIMESKVTESFNPANVGKTVSNFSKFQAQFQTRYQFTDQFAMGAAVKHKSKRYGGQPDRFAQFVTNPDGSFYYQRPVPAYTVGDLFAEYKVADNIEFRVNVNNITNEKYYLAVYQGGFFMYKGDARQIVGTLDISF